MSSSTSPKILALGVLAALPHPEAALAEPAPRAEAPARPGQGAKLSPAQRVGARGMLPRARRTLTARARELPEGPIRIAFFDADSTLRVSRSGSPSANHRTDVKILPSVAPRLRELAAKGYLLAIVSNQAGVAEGYVSFESADGALRFTMSRLAAQGALFDYYDFAELRDDDRKPGIGMARRLGALVASELGRPVDWSGSFMVGDSAWKKGVDLEPDGTPGVDFSNSDRLFAESVRRELAGGRGFAFHHPRDYFGWSRHGIRNFVKLSEVESYEAGQAKAAEAK